MIDRRRSLGGVSKLVLALLVGSAALAAACSKAPAEAALKAADEAVAAVSADGQKFAPEQWKALAEAAKAAREQFDRGDYTAARTSAEKVFADAKEVVKAAATKKEEVTKAWADMQTRLPAMGEAIRAKLTELSAMKKLPKGVDKSQLESATAGLAAFDTAWGEAGANAQAGDIMAAVEKAQGAGAKASELMSALGLTPPAEGAPSTQAPPPGK
jgi:hypothetical protein